MTTTIRAINAGNRLGDKFEVYLEGEYLRTVKRGEMFDITGYTGKNLRFESVNDHESPLVGNVQITVTDPPGKEDD